MNSAQRKRLKNNEKGMVAITITVILLLVISLTVLGFSKVIRREQRQALDYHLSTRAFYAAESGINIAKKAVANNPVTTSKSDCDNPAGGPFTDAELRLDDQGTEVTCLMLDTQPRTLEYTGLAPLEAKYIPIEPVGGNPGGLILSWQDDTDSTADFNGCSGPPVGTFPAGNSWGCRAPALRVDLAPMNSTSYGGSTVPNEVRTFILYPRDCNGGNCTNTVNYNNVSGDGQGQVVGVGCENTARDASEPLYCTADIQNIPGVGNGVNYKMRVMSLYRTSRLIVQPRNLSSGVRLANAQVLIDSTGKAVDVLRRIQARISLSGDVPDFAIQADEVCKRYRITSTTVHTESSSPSSCGQPESTPMSGWVAAASTSTGNNLSGAFGTGTGSSGGATTTTSNEPPRPYYTRYFYISSAPQGVTINSCTWTWGDGQTETKNGSDCDNGDVVNHTYPRIAECTDYTVQLVFSTSGGTVSAPNRTITEPHGIAANC